MTAKECSERFRPLLLRAYKMGKRGEALDIDDVERDFLGDYKRICGEAPDETMRTVVRVMYQGMRAVYERGRHNAGKAVEA